MNKVVDWVKSNVFIVIFGLLIVAAIIVLPILAAGMNRGVMQTLEERKQYDRDLTGLSNTGIDLQDPTPGFTPPEQNTALINPAVLREYRTYTEGRTREVDQINQQAIEFNRKGRSVLVPQLFPDPPAHARDTLVGDMSIALVAAYRKLLDEINAGSPPTLASMRDNLDRVQRQTINAMSRASVDDLAPDERRKLQETLSELRLSLATDAALQIGVYASMDVINPPAWTIGQPIPTATERFEWQWTYWIIEDLLRAIGDVNSDASSVIDAPVKRIRSITMVDAPGSSEKRRDSGRQWTPPSAPPTPGGGGGGGPTPGGGGGGIDPGAGGAGGGFRGGGAGQSEGGAGTPAAAPFDPSKEVPRNFESSFTGRTTNPLYDVRYARMHIIVDTARIPEVLDAIGRQNFMTIVSMDLWPADPYADLEAGYIYGAAPTSELVLDIESVWLRSWTTQFMPQEVKNQLGIVTAPPAGEGSGS